MSNKQPTCKERRFRRGTADEWCQTPVDTDGKHEGRPHTFGSDPATARVTELIDALAELYSACGPFALQSLELPGARVRAARSLMAFGRPVPTPLLSTPRSSPPVPAPAPAAPAGVAEPPPESPSYGPLSDGGRPKATRQKRSRVLRRRPRKP